MAVYNKIAVYINGINLTRYVVLPIKWANLLDEQLDEAVISLRNCPKKVIPPLTPVEIRITNDIIMQRGHNPIYSKSITKYMIVADQPDSNENPVGSKRYDHDLYIIEATKLLERTIVDSITYTNTNSKIFTANPTPMALEVTLTGNALQSDFNNYYKGEPSNFVTPLATGSNLVVPSFTDLWTLPNSLEAKWQNVSVALYDQNGEEVRSTTSITTGFTVNLKSDGIYTIVYNGDFSHRPGNSTIVRNFPTLTYTFTVVENKLPLKKWTIKDVINRLLDVAEPIRQGEAPRYKLNAEQAALFDNILAPQFSFTKQTLRECLQEIGGVVHGEPRLNIKNDGGGWYYEISYDMYGGTEISRIATRPYIKETVKQVIESYCTHIDTNAENLVNALGESLGSFFNGRNGVITEPYDGGFKTVRCDTLYARITEDNMLIATQLPIYAIQKLECGIITGNESATTKTETSSPSIVADTANYSGSYSYTGDGTLIGASITLTDETGTGGNATATVTSISGNTVYYTINNTAPALYSAVFTFSVFAPLDITPYVFEASEYNSRLSSYASAYPYSKAYGIMFTQGQKNITALNFKQEHPISDVFSKYAIVNILSEVSGQTINITPDNGGVSGGYPLLAFRITYTPFYSARVAQTKPYYKDFPRGSALVYNQGSNVIESRYYGENLKGVIARLGNVELSKTYRLSRLGHIPKAGQKYDDDYYISAVSVEMYTNLITVTIGLSKDFNRLSQYIGISSTKRYSEVSQTQAQERNVLYREYIVIGDSETADSDSLIGDSLMNSVRATFTQSGDFSPLTNVVAWGTTAQGNALPIVQLPVICSAFGNSMSFEWAYEDNYSAGAVSQYETGGTGGSTVTGYFQNNYRYTDYYGRMYYYNFDLQRHGTQPESLSEQSEIGLALPAYDGAAAPTSSSGYFSTIGKTPFLMRKDNRETIKVNVQIDFVTNRKGIIIGSALASNNPAVGGIGLFAAKLYVFTDTLDKFINHVAGSKNVTFDSQTVGDWTVQTLALPSVDIELSSLSNGRFSIGVSGDVFPGTSGTKYKAWAIVTSAISETEEVEDETGESATQTVQYGGDVLIAQNMDFEGGELFPLIYFTRKREVFDKSVWTTAR